MPRTEQGLLSQVPDAKRRVLHQFLCPVSALPERFTQMSCACAFGGRIALMLIRLSPSGKRLGSVVADS